MSAVGVPGFVAGAAVEDGFVGGFGGCGGRGRGHETTGLWWLLIVVDDDAAATVVEVVLEEGLTETGIMRDAGCLALDEFAKEG
jgi:hypothetical protein